MIRSAIKERTREKRKTNLKCHRAPESKRILSGLAVGKGRDKSAPC